jgi:DMSO/TMAO reductase YedYZ molybdopterin-dependent catalytic subunit
MTVRPRLVTRRQALAAGVAAGSGVWLGGCARPMPPTYGSLLRLGDNLTYVAHRTLLPGASLAREYSRTALTSFPAVGTIDPTSARRAEVAETYRRWLTSGFGEWRLSVTGSVARPGTWSLAELKRLPSRTQVTKHTCEEGWTAIGEWTGVPLSRLLDAAGLQPSARFVTFKSVDRRYDSIDLLDALHPQTLLAYGMNGRDLPVAHGAPLRLRVERQIGYKSMKYLTELIVTDHLDDGGDRGYAKNGWAWYTGI